MKEAEITVTEENKLKINSFIHKYTGKKVNQDRCSPDWRKTHKEIKENPEMKKELVEKLKKRI